ncbi:dienelactone hydrolase family protein [Xanthovirga aplysinae]|uniref:dienelactone hydrolase family protein n=1 Tax=Xanthovirga aplysinae TaxID=2529853 RepID=UPI0012BBA4BC|nr:dienelactone hydrolase family protein [Xanthovirga aplysinae]MTI30722.1 hypothetical protein [Xanthovirga aplysinae]
MQIKEIDYKAGEQNLKGYLVYNKKGIEKRPAILVVHDWNGCDEFVKHKAQLIAEIGYVGFAVDMYGNGQIGQNDEDKSQLMDNLLENRILIQERMLAALNTVKILDQVDSEKIGTIGYCFGGLCALDLARSGAAIKGVCCFHGVLTPPTGLSKNNIKAKILALQGYNDPFVPFEQIKNFAQEMSNAKVDWQLHMYGQARHSFTKQNPPGKGEGIQYNEPADKRSWRLMKDFLAEIF